MRNSIKKMVGIRVAAALASVLLFSVMMTVNILNMESSLKASHEASAVLERAQRAEAAHYKWSSNLSNALYAGTDFTGSTDPTTCVLGQWLYGDAGTEDPQILSLRQEMEPLHKELHASATEALSMTTVQAQNYYQDTIQKNLTSLVGMLDQVIERSTVLNEASIKSTNTTIVIMHTTSIVD